jgi:uncharacterized protein (TIGR00369 family)
MSTVDSTAAAAESSPPPWREPARGGYPDPALFALSGLDRLRAFAAETTPRPPLQYLTGLRLVDVGSGSAVFEMPLSEWLCSPQGAISIGPLSIPADAALGCAVQTLLPAATSFTTSELSLRLLAPPRPTGKVIARANVVHAGRTLSLSEATVTDEHGRLLAHGSSLCVVSPVASPVPDPPPPSASAPAPVYATADPWARPPQGAVVDQAIWDRQSGLAVLRGHLAGELSQPPVGRLTGLRLSAADEGTATFAMPATEWLCAPPPGRAQGGTVALLAEAALGAAIQTSLPPATALGLVDLKVNYLRPLTTDGRDAIARGRLQHAGRRIAVASSEVTDGAGKPVALATGSAMLLPGRPASFAVGQD